MENRDWTAELQRRISKHLAWLSAGGGHAPAVDTALDRIMADVEVFGVLKAREGYTGKAIAGFSGSVTSYAEERLTQLFPLPMRTRQVLREEPVPRHRPDLEPYTLLFRWKNALESRQGGQWELHPIDPTDLPLMKHAVDLAENPYRTEQVPADENNPWPEIEP
jgi:hypothetical protein